MALERAWDDVNGKKAEPAEEEPIFGFWSRKNYLRAVEDAEEQNDNNFDGIINNISDEKDRKREQALQAEEAQEKRESVIRRMQEECVAHMAPAARELPDVSKAERMEV